MGNCPQDLLEWAMSFAPDGISIRPCRTVTTELRYFICQNEIRWSIPDSFPLRSFDIVSIGQGISFPSLLSPPALLPVILEATSSQAPSHVLQLAGAGLPGLLAAQLVEPQAGNHLTLTNGFPLHLHVFCSLPRF